MEDPPLLAHPTLYGRAASGEVAIFGQRCARCGQVSFPRQSFGCESCGAHGADLRAEDLPAAGELISFAAVRRYHGRDIEVPFIMAEVRLESGPLLRCALTARDEAGLRPGAPVRGALALSEGPDGPLLELRFEAVGA